MPQNAVSNAFKAINKISKGVQSNGLMALHRHRMFEWKPSAVVVISPCPSSSLFAVAREDGSLELWDMEQTACIQTANGKNVEISSLAWAHDNVDGNWRTFASYLDGTVAEVAWISSSVKYVVDSYAGVVWGMASMPLEHVKPGYSHPIAAACDDGSLRLLGVEGGEPGVTLERVITRLEGRLLSVSWMPDGQRLVTAGTAGTIHVVDYVSGREALRISAAPSSASLAASFCIWKVLSLPDGTIVSGDSDGATQFFESRYGTLQHRAVQHKGAVLALAASLDGTTVFSSGVDSRVAIFKQTGGDAAHVRAAAFAASNAAAGAQTDAAAAAAAAAAALSKKSHKRHKTHHHGQVSEADASRGNNEENGKGIANGSKDPLEPSVPVSYDRHEASYVMALNRSGDLPAEKAQWAYLSYKNPHSHDVRALAVVSMDGGAGSGVAGEFLYHKLGLFRRNLDHNHADADGKGFEKKDKDKMGQGKNKGPGSDSNAKSYYSRYRRNESGGVLISGGVDAQLLAYPVRSFLEVHPTRLSRCPQRPLCQAATATSLLLEQKQPWKAGASITALPGMIPDALADSTQARALVAAAPPPAKVLVSQPGELNLWQLAAADSPVAVAAAAASAAAGASRRRGGAGERGGGHGSQNHNNRDESIEGSHLDIVSGPRHLAKIVLKDARVNGNVAVS
eukprot:CAMPEP_0175063382 /NCGR_PEP_ID=MMETSP0052_2-20121109/14723_1 /TAXON_ID=51329 ORGANISM="Polytomella parva, Strain SAG 63-3" /NCGR_SAMPLE_ID=MMETSP0052_2 /ASSEMBLY_ACC=CAM_ASM_000194 /LENGTH=680 /DNA_ID=CAMNT_0016329569 /DNA_START=74 /DNA_END=2113 /DNA_ORIENTATION=-